MKRVERVADRQGLFDNGAKIGTGALGSIGQHQRRAFEAGVDQIGFQRLRVLQVLFRRAALHLVERRLRDIEVAALDHFRHLPVEEGEQKRADVGAVDVGVGHDDDLVVAQLVDVEFLAADAGAECRDQRADFSGAQHLVEARALDIEDLAAQRQHGLVLAVAGLLGGTAGRVTLDDEDFGLRRIALLAIGELAGQ